MCFLCEEYFSKLALSMCIQCAQQQIFLFLVFLKTSFWAGKKKFSPFFSETAGPIGWNCFYKYFSQIGVGFFFFASKCRSYKIWQPLENSHHRKKRVFDGFFSILLLLTYVFGIFQKKTHTLRFGPSNYKKIFSSKKWNLDFCEGENFWWFLALGTSKTPWRRHLRTLSLWQLLLYSLRSICPESFINFRRALS